MVVAHKEEVADKDKIVVVVVVEDMHVDVDVDEDIFPSMKKERSSKYGTRKEQSTVEVR